MKTPPATGGALESRGRRAGLQVVERAASAEATIDIDAWADTYVRFLRRALADGRLTLHPASAMPPLRRAS